MERLQKYLASAGVGSRRECERLITSGLVKVNGCPASELGVKVEPGKDTVEYNGKKIELPGKKVYIKFNKPPGYISSAKEYEGESIYKFFKGLKERVFYIGRLDRDSSGLMLLTNDGELALKLSHPRYEHEKEYEVTALFPISDDQISKLRRGVELSDGITRPAKVERLGAFSVRITIREGRNRQIKRMLRAVNNRVEKLKRVRIANVKLGSLKEGEWAYIQSSSIA